MLQYCLEFDDPNEGFRGSDTVYGWFINCHFLNFEFGLSKKKRERVRNVRKRERSMTAGMRKREREGKKGNLQEKFGRENEKTSLYSHTH